MKLALAGLCLGLSVLATTAVAGTKPLPSPDWQELGHVHVRDSAEKDLALQ